MQAINHKNYRISATAFKNEGGKWVGQAKVQSLKGELNVIQNPMIFDNEYFETREEAEDFALDGAQFFIDSAPDASSQ